MPFGLWNQHQQENYHFWQVPENERSFLTFTHMHSTNTNTSKVLPAPVFIKNHPYSEPNNVNFLEISCGAISLIPFSMDSKLLVLESCRGSFLHLRLLLLHQIIKSSMQLRSEFLQKAFIENVIKNCCTTFAIELLCVNLGCERKGS